MRCSSIPSSFILAATAALSFGACGVDQTQPGGAGATPPAMATAPAAGSGTAAAAGMTGATAAAGKTGTSTSPVTGAAGGGTTTTTTTTTTTASGTAGTPASGGAAGASTAASGAAGASTAAGAAGASAGAAGGGAAAGGAVTFTKVHEEVLTGAGCAAPGSCHGNAQGPSKLGFADMDDAYMGLVGVMAMGTGLPGSTTGGCMGMPIMRVKAGDPTMSLLVQKLENKQTCGQQMPPGGSISADKIQLVKDWIMAGAKKD